MSYNHLTIEERNIIYRMRWQGYKNSEIAKCLGRNRSTIARELKRNLNCQNLYNPGTAQTMANIRRKAHLHCSKTGNSILMAYVVKHLQQYWSPEQISGQLSAYPPDALNGITISHTTIYRWIWADPQRAQQFRQFMRIAKKTRRKTYGKPSRQGQILGKRSIDERPAEATERLRIGHWEGDTMVGKARKGYILTCVDRASRYLIARKLQTCASEPVAKQLEQTIRRLPASKRHSLTLDNGREFARPIELERRLRLEVFFAHPYHSWERGTNENTNGLLRQFIPKGSDISALTDEQLLEYVNRLNHRPRKCLGYKSPHQVFHQKIKKRFVLS